MKKNPVISQKTTGFTLVELLVVILIIAALAAVTFTVGPRMKKRGDFAKTLQSLRQIGTASALYSSETEGRLPPLRAESLNEDGSYTTTPCTLILLKQVYPEAQPSELASVKWWEINQPFMLNPLMPNNLKSGNFKPDKPGYGMNKNLTYALAGTDTGNNWVTGKGGQQTIGVSISKVNRPTRTPLYATAPDFLYNGSRLNEASSKPLIVDGKFPVIFVDGHAESVALKSYTNANYDYAE